MIKSNDCFVTNYNMCSALLCVTSHSAESLINAVEESQPDASLVIQILHVYVSCEEACVWKIARA